MARSEVHTAGNGGARLIRFTIPFFATVQQQPNLQKLTKRVLPDTADLRRRDHSLG